MTIPHVAKPTSRSLLAKLAVIGKIKISPTIIINTPNANPV